MALKCHGPDCEHEFSDSVIDNGPDARDDGETPYWSRTFVPEDGFGVATAYYCSDECARKALEKEGEA